MPMFTVYLPDNTRQIVEADSYDHVRSMFHAIVYVSECLATRQPSSSREYNQDPEDAILAMQASEL